MVLRIRADCLQYRFQDVSDGATRTAELSLEVLNEMIKEIGWTEEANSRQIPSAFRDLTVAERQHLDLLSRCCGHATVSQLALAAELMEPDSGWSRSVAEERAGLLVERGLLEIESPDGVVKFKGDSLDKAFCRVYARRQGERVGLTELRFEKHFGRAVLDRAFGQGDIRSRLPAWPLSSTASRIDAMQELILSSKDGWDGVSIDRSLQGDLLRLLEVPFLVEGRQFNVVLAKIPTEWNEDFAFMTLLRRRVGQENEGGTDPSDVDDLTLLKQRTIEAVVDISGVIGTSVSIELLRIDAPAEKLRDQWIVESGNLHQKRQLQDRLSVKAVDLWLNGDRGGAVEVITRASAVGDSALVYNNAGYMSLANGQIESAVESLREASSRDRRNPLFRYNYALALAMTGEQDAAIEQLDSLDQLDQMTPGGVMLIPLGRPGALEVEERHADPDEGPHPHEAGRDLRALLTGDDGEGVPPHTGAG